MTLKELADVLVAANKSGAANALLDEHYAQDAVSVEAVAMDPTRGRETVGLDGIRGKHAWWDSAMETHGVEVEGPFLHGEDRFACVFKVDATDRESGNRMQMHEVAVYHVKDGKIVREEFFYDM
ncbi:MAG: SnoaL-like domain-containing protein [Pseudomonadota bacterium]